MADNSKSKFSKEKLAKFFDKEGFYIVLFLCVCIVAITAVWVSRSGIKDNPEQQNQEITETKQNETEGVQPTKEASQSTDESVKNPAVNDKVSSEPQNTDSAGGKIASTNTSVGTPAKTTSVPSSLKLGDPTKVGISKETIMRDYSPDEPVLFEIPSYEWRTHAGLDVKVVEGTEVLAAMSGKVVDIRDDNEYAGGLGWLVVVDHGNGYKTVYGNLDEPTDLKLNATIKKGERIGVIGSTSIFEGDAAAASTEDSAVSHLHFEVLKIGANKAYTNVDPKEYLTMQN
jgi:murein DD-endopeptidase MepM/ murein hydrolase activator NlpD